MGEYLENLKCHLRFGKKEVQQIVLASFLMAFMFAFDDKSETFRPMYWFGNFLLFIIIVLISLSWRILVQKAVAISAGFRGEFKLWTYGLGIGTFLTVISRGNLILLIPGGMFFYHMAADRIGHFRYGLNYATMSWVAATGSIANIALGMLLKEIMKMMGLSIGLFDRFIYVNFLLAVFMLLPIPPLDGATAWFGSRMQYVIVFGLIFGYVSLYVMQIYSLILAVAVAFFVWVVYYVIFERSSFG